MHPGYKHIHFRNPSYSLADKARRDRENTHYKKEEKEMKEGIYIEKHTGKLYQYIEETVYIYDSDKNKEPCIEPVVILVNKHGDIFSVGDKVVVNKEEFEKNFEYSHQFSNALVKVKTIDEIRDYIKTAEKREAAKRDNAQELNNELKKLSDIILSLRSETQDEMEEEARKLKNNYEEG